MEENKKNETINKEQIVQADNKIVTYSTSEGEKLDLLEIIENFLCQSCVRI